MFEPHNMFRAHTVRNRSPLPRIADAFFAFVALFAANLLLSSPFTISSRKILTAQRLTSSRFSILEDMEVI